MMSRKLHYKLFQYKKDFSVMRLDVDTILRKINADKRFNKSPFIEEALQLFKNL